MTLPVVQLWNNMRARWRISPEQMGENRFLAEALAREKMEGHRIAVGARTVALVICGLFVVYLYPTWSVLYYLAIIAAQISIGWMQYSMAKVGRSRIELYMIFLDLLLMTIAFTVPNPFAHSDFPTPLLYRFDTFQYFYILLALATLAYSWRTLTFFAIWLSLVWFGAAFMVDFFSFKIPSLDASVSSALTDYPTTAEWIMPNDVMWNNRIQNVMVFVIIVVILSIRGYRSSELMIQQAEIASQRANLSRYFPSSLVDSLASQDHDIGAVRTQEAAVLFTDIVGFTQYAERNPPQQVMDTLRTYHTFVERIIFEHGGTLEKYMGDGVMATFGRPTPHHDDALNAMRAAQQIVQENKDFNIEQEKRGLEPFKVSVGVHYGSVLIGDIGPERRLEFAVLGDTVNVASRLEAETRKLECQCIVSTDLVSRFGENLAQDAGLKPKGDISLRGRSKPVNVWTD